MSQRVDDLTELQRQVDLARQMEYGITSQSHFRAMALLTGDDANNAKIANAKGAFLENLRAVEAISPGEKGEFFDDLRETNDQFRVSSEKVLALYEAGRIEEALALHMADEHAISHLLEPAIRELVADASTETAAASAAFDSDKSFLRTMVLSISSASLALAILMGFVLSLAFIRPVRQIGYVLARVAGGDFSQRVDVPNRDEFGGLSRNVNRMSEQLGDLYQDLRQELRERERAEARLERRAIELVAVNNELEAFSHSVFHDLLGPLRTIDRISQAILDHDADNLGDDGTEDLRRVRTATGRMGELIDEMMNMSQVCGMSSAANTELDRTTVDLSELAQTVASELMEREPERQVEFAIKDGLTANADPQRLRITLESLLGNSWEFTRRHPRAKIEFGATDHEGHTAYFVRDDGAGFDMAEAGKLFGPFSRLHSAADFEGVGIGLVTVQRIVQAHGGRVWAEGAVSKLARPSTSRWSERDREEALMTPATDSQLLVEGGPQDQETIDLQGPTITMGRQPDNDIFVSEAMVSRHHAEIVMTDAGCFLRDLYSSNGTHVNEKKIPEGDYALKDGDRIQLAASEVSFVFRSVTALTQQMTQVQTAVVVTLPETPPGEEPADAEEAVPEPDDEGLYEGIVHLLLLVEGGMGLIFNFTQQLRERLVFRLLRLNNNSGGGVDIWLGLREPVALEQTLLEMEGIVQVSPEPEEDGPSLRVMLKG